MTTTPIAAPAEAAEHAFAPPASIVAPKGLPSHRASLARWTAWRAEVAADVERLDAGRRDLAREVERLERARSKSEAKADTAADDLLASIKAGGAMKISGVPAVADDGKLAVAARALAKLDAEIETRRETLDQIDSRISKLVNAALAEQGREIEAALSITVSNLREQVAQLIALRRVTGAGWTDKVVIDIPAFDGAHPWRPLRIDENHVAGAADVWRKLASTWRDDPAVKPKLAFPGYDPKKAAAVQFHEKTQTEMRLMDLDRVNRFA